MHLFELEFSPDMCPGVGLQDYMVALFLVFSKTLYTVLQKKHKLESRLPGEISITSDMQP